jgi:hypothetical protein
VGAGQISTVVVVFAEGVLKTMRLTKLKLLAAVLAVVGLIGIVAVGVTQLMLAGAQSDVPRPLPADIVAPWREAGAEVGWMRPNPTDRRGVCPFFPEAEGKAGDLPAFRFERWPAGRVAKLPAPGSAFGLCVRGTKITDAGLEELAGLKNLQALDLSNTPVTGAGLKELAGLQQLQEVDLADSRVTGPGVGALAGLKELRTLAMSETQLGQEVGLPPASYPEVVHLQQLKTLVVRTDPQLRKKLREEFNKTGNQAGMFEARFNALELREWWRKNMPHCQKVYVQR